MPAIVTNFHEGSRSEYLAQFVFAKFGTAVPVPHQEDYGLDLYCTLLEQDVNLSWPTAYFSVQVKSNHEPWIFKDERSVRWLVEYPLPLFFCVIDKSSALISVYHTTPRSFLWSLPPLPSRLELTLGASPNGQCMQWASAETFSLSAPILEFTIQEMLKDGFHENAKNVLSAWVSIDQENLLRIKTGIHLVEAPHTYTTNSSNIMSTGRIGYGIRKAPDQNLQLAAHRLKQSLSWIIEQLNHRDDIVGAALAALLQQHLSENRGEISSDFCRKLNSLFGIENYVEAGLDRLGWEFAAAIQHLSAKTKGD